VTFAILSAVRGEAAAGIIWPVYATITIIIQTISALRSKVRILFIIIPSGDAARISWEVAEAISIVISAVAARRWDQRVIL